VEEKTMKHLRLWVTLDIFGLLAAVGSVVLLHAQGGGDLGYFGRSYLTTITDSTGTFVSRGVITLHSDRTISVTDSGQGGPYYYFSSQLGSWKPDSNGRIVARTIDFDFPPSPSVVARVDFTFDFGEDPNQVTGTITVTYFPLEADPLGGGGTVVVNDTLVGELIKP
jgi:hypothetical protein